MGGKQSPAKIFSDVAGWLEEKNTLGIVSLEHDIFPESVGWATQILDMIVGSKYTPMPVRETFLLLELIYFRWGLVWVTLNGMMVS